MACVRSWVPRGGVLLSAGMAIILMVCGVGPSWGLDVPPLTGRIVDTANLLPPELVQTLSRELESHEQRTGNQVVVLTVPSLQGQAIAEFSHHVATSWHLGQKGKDNGVLLLVAPAERKVRIEVGYGLEGTLTDAKSAQIIRNVMLPRFRAGDLPGGIAEGLRAILGTIEGTPVASADNNRHQGSDGGPLLVFVLAVVVGTTVGLALRALRQWMRGGTGGLLAFFIAFAVGAALALAAAVVTFVLIQFFSSATGRRGRNRNGSDWFPGGSTAGIGGWGGGGSDTFSGGGGDFGGGGADASW